MECVCLSKSVCLCECLGVGRGMKGDIIMNNSGNITPVAVLRWMGVRGDMLEDGAPQGGLPLSSTMVFIFQSQRR